MYNSINNQLFSQKMPRAASFTSISTAPQKNLIADQQIIERDPLPKCLYHPSYFIHNFCANEECLMPMCAECVTLHTQQHEENHTYGKYLSFYGARQDLKNHLNNSLKFYESLSQQYTQDYQQKLTIKESFVSKFKQFRQRMCKQVERTLNQIQSDLQMKIQRYVESVYDNYQNIEEQIQQQYRKVKKEIQTLYKQKGIKTIIQYYGGFKESLQEKKKHFRKEIQSIKYESLIVEVPDGIPDKIHIALTGLKILVSQNEIESKNSSQQKNYMKQRSIKWIKSSAGHQN